MNQGAIGCSPDTSRVPIQISLGVIYGCHRHFEICSNLNFSDPRILFWVPLHCPNSGEQVPKFFPALVVVPGSSQRSVSPLPSSMHLLLGLSKTKVPFRLNRDVVHLVGQADQI